MNINKTFKVWIVRSMVVSESSFNSQLLIVFGEMNCKDKWLNWAVGSKETKKDKTKSCLDHHHWNF